METRLRKKLLYITLLAFLVPFILLSTVFTLYFLNIASSTPDYMLYGQHVSVSIILGIAISFFISFIIGIIFFILLRKRYQKQDVITSSFRNKIKNMNAIEIDQLRKQFKLSTSAFYAMLLEWVERFNFTVDGDFILTNEDNLSDAINDLENLW